MKRMEVVTYNSDEFSSSSTVSFIRCTLVGVSPHCKPKIYIQMVNFRISWQMKDSYLFSIF